MVGKRPMQIKDRFYQKFKADKKTGCWNWLDHLGKDGRGRFRLAGIKNYAELSSRVSWILHYGEIPMNMCVCHKCDNTSCVNPRHLFLGTQRDNMRDMIRKNRDNRRKGSRHPNAKLKESDVRFIRRSKLSNTELASKYGVSRPVISCVRRRVTWTHI